MADARCGTLRLTAGDEQLCLIRKILQRVPARETQAGITARRPQAADEGLVTLI